MFNLLKSKSGMALVYVILIVTVVTVAGVTVYSVSASDTFQAEKDASAAQAYYYAKSGVEIAIGYIMEGKVTFSPGSEVTYYGNLGDVFGQTAKYDESGKKAYNISFTIKSTVADNESKFEINSTGYVGLAGSNGYIDSSGSNGAGGSGAEATSNALAFEITKQELEKSVEGGQTIEVGEGTPAIVDSNLECNYTLFVNKDIDLDSGSPTIRGPVGLNSGVLRLNYSSLIQTLAGAPQGIVYLGPTAGVTHPEWREVDWKEVPFTPAVVMPDVPALPEFPVLPTVPTIPDGGDTAYSDDITGSRTVSLAGGSVAKYRKISLQWDDVLTINLTGNATVIVDEYTATGQLKVGGDGVLTLVVKNNVSSRTLMNEGGDPIRLILFATGSNLNFGSGSVVAGTIYAPNASMITNNTTDISGDIIAGGTSFQFGSLSHNGNLYILNPEAVVGYSGNRSLQSGVKTNIYFNGKLLDIAPAHLDGIIRAYNSDATIRIGSSSTFTGNVLTKGKSITLDGAAIVTGHIVAPNVQSVVKISEGAEYVGAIIAESKSVLLSGGVVDKGIIFTPKASVFVTGGASFNGSITAETFTADGGTTVYYKEAIFDDLPVLVQPTTDASVTTTNWRVYGTWIKG